MANKVVAAAPLVEWAEKSSKPWARRKRVVIEFIVLAEMAFEGPLPGRDQKSRGPLPLVRPM